jgi:hypothetical protein
MDTKKVTTKGNLLDQPQGVVKGKSVSGRVWKGEKKRFIVGIQDKPKPNHSREDFKKMKELENKLKGEIELERKEEKRRIQQKRRAKEEKMLKEKNLEGLKQKKKSNGKNQRLSRKEWIKVKGAQEFNIKTTQL